MDTIFKYADDFGPSKIIHIYEPGINLRGVLVVDNVAIGPSIGGLRMAPDVSTEECVRLARAMTLKNAAAELPHGGGKSVLFGDPRMPVAQKSELIRAMASSLRHTYEYIFGPDMGTNEECMAWVKDETGRAVGLPRELGGIPLDEIGATGWGVAHAAAVTADYCDLDINGARVAVQGFGAVGQHAARFLTGMGAVLVGASDSRACIHEADGLNVKQLCELKAAGKSVGDAAQGKSSKSDAIVDVECDIWIPAARPDVLTENNIYRLNTKMVIQGANIPATAGAEKALHEKGVLNIPDFIANAGGVICAAMEYAGSTQSAAMSTIEEKIRRNTKLVLDASRQNNSLPREAAVALATKRLKKAMQTRRWSTFSSAPRFM